MSSYRPAQVFASFTEKTDGKRQTRVAADEPIPSRMSGSNQIKVSATEEAELPPDRCRVNIILKSLKEDVSEVKNSVQRRLDYILQSLNNFQIKEGDIKVQKQLLRQESLFMYTVEILVLFVDFKKCETISNHIIEKLDESVTVGTPQFFHSQQRLEHFRRHTSVVAVKNAKEKALQMAQCLNQSVGRPINIEETENNEWEGDQESTDIPANVLSMQKRLQNATIHMCVKLNATFELKTRVKSKDEKR
ncbi:unnamed protein product [Owenia fusiformis]|uniref:Uncharacterized protein n=1 Tax=Owenia fusiformis TaxID=6347 RepID=A0A8J1TDX0_OWEFU|nr:unnamed protein product [Owenia fusiformis]